MNFLKLSLLLVALFSVSANAACNSKKASETPKAEALTTVPATTVATSDALVTTPAGYICPDDEKLATLSATLFKYAINLNSNFAFAVDVVSNSGIRREVLSELQQLTMPQLSFLAENDFDPKKNQFKSPIAEKIRTVQEMKAKSLLTSDNIDLIKSYLGDKQKALKINALLELKKEKFDLLFQLHSFPTLFEKFVHFVIGEPRKCKDIKPVTPTKKTDKQTDKKSTKPDATPGNNDNSVKKGGKDVVKSSVGSVDGKNATDTNTKVSAAFSTSSKIFASLGSAIVVAFFCML